MTQLKEQTELINLRLDISTMEALKAEATKRGVPYKTLILTLLDEKLLEEKKPHN